MRSSTLNIVLGGILVMSSTACVINEPESPPRGVVVNGPPPAPVKEEPPARPNASAVWVTGYWHWTGMQYAWIPGHWEAPPPGSTWSPPVYSMREGRHVYESGGWRGGGNQPKNALR